MEIEIIAIYLIGLFVVGFSGIQLRKRNPADIRVIFYFFSLAVVVTTILSMLATSMGSIDSKGEFIGKFGNFLSFILHEAINIKNGIFVFLAISALITLPQVLNYLLCGVFGVATVPMFTKQSVGLVILGIVKSTAVAAGVLLTVAIYGNFIGWTGMDASKTIALGAFAVLMLVLAFVTAMQYRDATDIGKFVVTKVSPQSKNVFSKAHSFFTRRQDC